MPNFAVRNSSDDNMNISKIAMRTSLPVEVANRIRRQIQSGKLSIGEKLPVEAELVKMFGVGRSSVREAVRLLANEGLLSIEQGRGTFVRKAQSSTETFEQRIRRSDITELREVRKMMECQITELAAMRHTDEDISEMKYWLALREKAAAADDMPATFEADINFHVAVAKASRNSIIESLYRDMTVYLRTGFEHIYDDTSLFVISQAIHEHYMAAIECRNIEEAKQWVTKLWEEVEPSSSER